AETHLDRAVFLTAARQLTGQNHALRADRENMTQLLGDIDILDNFAGKPIGDALLGVSFLFAGPVNEVDLFVEQTRGLPHLTADTGLMPQYAKAVVLTGSLFHWATLVVEGCRRTSPLFIREAYTKVHHQLCSKGLHGIFDGY